MQQARILARRPSPPAIPASPESRRTNPHFRLRRKCDVAPQARLQREGGLSAALAHLIAPYFL